MKKRNISIIIFAVLLLGIGLSAIKYYFDDVYMMSLDGKIDKISINIQEAMFVTVSEKEHNFSHFWPKFQTMAEVGDSVFKKPRDYKIILIKKGTHRRIVCDY
ncbi:MAG: hypothetical protein ABI113_05215 [Mucilaginibacter sp.]